MSPLALASSSWIRRAFAQNEDFLPASGVYSTPVLLSLPKSMHNNAKSMHSHVQCFAPAASHQEEKGGADPDLL